MTWWVTLVGFGERDGVQQGTIQGEHAEGQRRTGHPSRL